MCISIEHTSWQMVLYILPKHVSKREVCWVKCQCCCSRESVRYWSNWANNKSLHSYCQEPWRSRSNSMRDLQVASVSVKQIGGWETKYGILYLLIFWICFTSRGYDFSKTGFGPRTVILCDQVVFMASPNDSNVEYYILNNGFLLSSVKRNIMSAVWKNASWRI